MVSSAFVLLSLLASAAAQQRAVEAVVADLAAPAAITVAKAAAEARELEGREVTNALRRGLAAWRDVEGDEASCVRALLLDALIRHDAKLPGDQLLPLLGDELAGGPAFVLLCRSGPTDEAALLEAYRLTPVDRCVRRRALGSLLVKLRSPLFVEELVRAGALQLRVVVGDQARLMIAQPDLDSVLPASLPVPQGFPEPSVYVLESAPMPSYRTEAMRIGSLVEVAPGVRASRRQPTRRPFAMAVYAATRRDDDSLVQAWMQELSGVQLPPPFLLLRGDDQKLELKLTRARDRMRAGIATALSGLQSRNLISAARAAEVANDDVFVLRDERADQAPPLPLVPRR